MAVRQAQAPHPVGQNFSRLPQHPARVTPRVERVHRGAQEPHDFVRQWGLAQQPLIREAPQPSAGDVTVRRRLVPIARGRSARGPHATGHVATVVSKRLARKLARRSPQSLIEPRSYTRQARSLRAVPQSRHGFLRPSTPPSGRQTTRGGAFRGEGSDVVLNALYEQAPIFSRV